eukprot:4347735-Ditylum_brightwellii.AAC.1
MAAAVMEVIAVGEEDILAELVVLVPEALRSPKVMDHVVRGPHQEISLCFITPSQVTLTATRVAGGKYQQQDKREALFINSNNAPDVSPRHHQP